MPPRQRNSKNDGGGGGLNLPDIISALSTAAAESGDRVFRARRRVDYFRRVAQIYADMKLTSARAAGLPLAEREALWETAHERNGARVADLALSLRGFYIKGAQLLSTRADFVPAAWIARLRLLQDDVPPMEPEVAQAVLEGELAAACDLEFAASRKRGGGSKPPRHCRVYGEGAGRVPAEAVFEGGIDFSKPLGSASLACVYKAKLRATGAVVAVKVQNPDARLVAGDVDSLVSVGKILEKTDLKVNFTAFLGEIRKQVTKELDFTYEAATQNSVRANLAGVRGVSVPRALLEYTTPKLLVMDFVEGRSLNEFKKESEGVPEWKRKVFGESLLNLMAASWGRMIFGSGLFHGDAHPGNLLISMRQRRLIGRFLPPVIELGIIDLGQAKQLSVEAQATLATLICELSAESPSPVRIAGALRSSGLEFERMGGSENEFLARAARFVFSTEDVDGKSFNPFGKDSILAENGVKEIPSDLVFVIRVIQMQRGIASALGCSDFSLSSKWRPAAQEFLYKQQRLYPFQERVGK